ncbi:MAG: hypothetical protein LBD55_01035, partial [Treponema sp.]|nr:hypothetical protein [Treponema sp.]
MGTAASVPPNFVKIDCNSGLLCMAVRTLPSQTGLKEAFDKSYNEHKKGNVFTKVKIDYRADIALTNFFTQNEDKINSWFNVITPKER